MWTRCSAASRFRQVSGALWPKGLSSVSRENLKKFTEITSHFTKHFAGSESYLWGFRSPLNLKSLHSDWWSCRSEWSRYRLQTLRDRQTLLRDVTDRLNRLRHFPATPASLHHHQPCTTRVLPPLRRARWPCFINSSDMEEGLSERRRGSEKTWSWTSWRQNGREINLRWCHQRDEVCEVTRGAFTDTQNCSVLLHQFNIQHVPLILNWWNIQSFLLRHHVNKDSDLLESHQILFCSGEVYWRGALIKWLYLHSSSSTRLQQRSGADALWKTQGRNTLYWSKPTGAKRKRTGERNTWNIICPIIKTQDTESSENIMKQFNHQTHLQDRELHSAEHNFIFLSSWKKIKLGVGENDLELKLKSQFHQHSTSLFILNWEKLNNKYSWDWTVRPRRVSAVTSVSVCCPLQHQHR